MLKNDASGKSRRWRDGSIRVSTLLIELPVVLVAFFALFARRDFVERFLFAALILMGDARLVTVGQRVERLESAMLVEPLFLADAGALLGMHDGGIGLNDGLVQTGQKAAVILPFQRTEAVLRRGDKARPVLFAVLNQDFTPFRRFLFARDQLTQFARRFVQTHLRQVEQGLQGKGAGHDRKMETRDGLVYSAPGKMAAKVLPPIELDDAPSS